VRGATNNTPEWLRTIHDWGWDHRLLKWKYVLQFLGTNRDADVLHGHYTPALALLAPQQALIHFHGLAVSELPLYRYGFARRRYHKAHYVFCAKHVREGFVATYPDIPQDQLHVLYNGIDSEAFKPSVLPRKPGPVRFSFHGRWVEHKGVLPLIQAVKLLETRGLEFECHLAGSPDIGTSEAGSGTYAREIEQALTGTKSVHRRGAIPYRELPGFLNEIDFGVVPSIYPDPFPLAPLELMACGKPVAAFRTGGLAEMIEDGRTGLLAEPYDPAQLADRIERLLISPSERTAMGKAARAAIEARFTWERHIDVLLRIYGQVGSV
jgi:glycosyltransferase involved in cell wall biosynthesis